MAIGGATGAAVARRMAITDLPQMVAGFHSLVGLAAVTTSIASYIAHPELMDPTHLTSTFLGAFIGAVTLTGELTSAEIPPPFPPTLTSHVSGYKLQWQMQT